MAQNGDTKYIWMWWLSEVNHKGAVGWEAGKNPAMDDWPLTSCGLVELGRRGRRVALWMRATVTPVGRADSRDEMSWTRGCESVRWRSCRGSGSRSLPLD